MACCTVSRCSTPGWWVPPHEASSPGARIFGLAVPSLCNTCFVRLIREFCLQLLGITCDWIAA